MAFISQEEKKVIAESIKPLLKKFGLKGSLSVDNHSTIVLTVKSGKIDFIGNFNEEGDRRNVNNTLWNRATGHIQVNPYWCHEHFTGAAKEFLEQAIPMLKGKGWFDKSDIMSDYHHVKHYVAVNIGKWDKAYELV